MTTGEINFRLPDVTQRMAIFGRTGSGKTQFGAWGLSKAPFNIIPYVIVDYKGDKLLNSIDRAKEIGFNEVPKHPGIYILHAEPDDEEEIEKWMRLVWARENVGLFFDEMYMLPQKRALRSILTQGRSKHIPAFCLSQRPVWVSRFVISEADFIAAFHLHDPDDRKAIQRLMPSETLKNRLDEFHCWWFDVSKDTLLRLSPVPDAEEILDTFDERLAPKRRFA